MVYVNLEVLIVDIHDLSLAHDKGLATFHFISYLVFLFLQVLALGQYLNYLQVLDQLLPELTEEM